VQYVFQRNSQKSTKANTWIYDSAFWITIKIKVTSYRDASSLTTKTWIPLPWPTQHMPKSGKEMSAVTDQKKFQNTTHSEKMFPVFGTVKGQYQNIIIKRAQQSTALITVRCCVKSWWQQLQADAQHYCQRHFTAAWQCPSTYCHPNCSNPQATALLMCWNTLRRAVTSFKPVHLGSQLTQWETTNLPVNKKWKNWRPFGMSVS
jgi:hypothetical protein